MILTKIIYRTSKDYQSFHEFVKNVEAEACIIDCAEGFEIINISFVNDMKAVIIYRQLEQEKK